VTFAGCLNHWIWRHNPGDGESRKGLLGDDGAHEKAPALKSASPKEEGCCAVQ